MKKTQKQYRLLSLILLVATVSTVFAFTGCIWEEKQPWMPDKFDLKVESDSIYVKKIKNLSDSFIMGMDASCVPSLEASGVTYYDHDGVEKDVYQILSENGVNYIRVRIWNDPFDADGNGYGGGNCDIENAIEVGKRATQYGMKLLVNFHYSDFWADPAKQMIPKAWKGMEIEQMSEALYTYTKDCLNQLVDAGVDIGMVQVGNETNGYLCGQKKWYDIAELMNAGSRAVREVCPEALVVLHFTNPEKVTNYKNYAYQLSAQRVDYDVFASSYYPAWHGTLENLTEVLNQVADTYGKKTMVAETAYVNTLDDTDFYGNGGTDGVKEYPFTEQGQANHLLNLIDACANDMNNCIGVFYWEGTWIGVGGETWEENSAIWEKYGSGWASSFASDYDPGDAGQYYGGCSVDNQAFFDANGVARESLKVFALARTGNLIENKADAIEDVTLIVDLNGEISLPGKVNAIMLDNSKQEIPVEWTQMAKVDGYNVGPYTDIDYSVMKNGGIAKYQIIGTAGGMNAVCTVSMVEYNFLKNWSFEDDANGSGWVATPKVSFDELCVEDKVSDSLTGTKHYHFWGSSAVEFELEQEVAGLKAGTYKYSISTMGGDCGQYEAYAYVKINGEMVKQTSVQFTVYNEWHTTLIEGIEVNEGDVVTVGVYVKAPGGAWGKIDDALLNSVK
ncbi:MAG: glycosyl hydrolase 53 family protein [Clostridia bacterium]|nr:glycosyl hydrolase 53 family protein [Clostridia bacterium]